MGGRREEGGRRGRKRMEQKCSVVMNTPPLLAAHVTFVSRK